MSDEAEGGPPASMVPEGWDLALVLGGGNALGAYHLGVCEALLGDGTAPSRIVGASIGAVTAAILVGNPPEARLDRLREFWRDAARPDWPWQVGPWPALLPAEARARWSNGQGLWTLLRGRPGLSALRLPGLWSVLPGAPPDQAVLDLAPLRQSLERLVDWDRLNAAPERLSVLAVDLDTAEEAWFDNRDAGIGPDEVLASSALLPLYPPVEIGGRILGDAGLRNNLPVERAFLDPLSRPLLCVASDLFGLGGASPASLDRAATRAQDLGFAAQGLRGIATLARERALLRRLDPGAPPAVLAHLAYDAPPHERSLKALDFSAAALAGRARQGREDAAALRDVMRDARLDEPLAVVRPPRAAKAGA